ncbi:MAG: hypothetical protein EBW55_07050 [Betaproteobacteria bacterium]|nr:hypothetical protein [Betaproteobacteria bacterium]
MLARRGMTHARAMRKRPNIAVVGAGWAGLACARLLQDNGFQVKVFEASRTIGGRARGLQVKLGAETYDLDNGQHLLIGAYRAVRALLTRYGNPQSYRFDAPDFRIRFQRASSSQSISQPMSQTMSQPMQLAKSGWPRQLHRMLATDPRPAGKQQSNQLLDRLALGLSQLSWLSGARSIPWPSLLELAALMRYARLQPPPMSCSVTSWLSGLGLRQSLVQRWIAALCESALNCPFDEACAMRLATVLNEAMASPQFDASDWMHQACDLSELLANGLAQGSAATTAKSEASALELYTANRVVGLTASPSSGDQAFTTHTWKLAIAGSDEHAGPFDALILALEPQSALALTIASQGAASDPPRCLLRLHKLLDDLPKPLGIRHDQDVFLNAVGGVRITEPAADLASLFSIVSSFKNRAIGKGIAVFGEVGLAGEIRPCPRGQDRIREAAKLGYRRLIVPKANVPRSPLEGLEILGVERLAQALDALWSSA